MNNAFVQNTIFEKDPSGSLKNLLFYFAGKRKTIRNSQGEDQQCLVIGLKFARYSALLDVSKV